MFIFPPSSMYFHSSHPSTHTHTHCIVHVPMIVSSSSSYSPGQAAYFSVEFPSYGWVFCVSFCTNSSLVQVPASKKGTWFQPPPTQSGLYWESEPQPLVGLMFLLLCTAKLHLLIIVMNLHFFFMQHCVFSFLGFKLRYICLFHCFLIIFLCIQWKKVRFYTSALYPQRGKSSWL